MNIEQFIIYVLIPSGIFGGIGGGLVTHLSNKKLDFQKRIMERRKEVYSEVHELLRGLFNTANNMDKTKIDNELLKYYREVQIWGSDEVIKKFTNLLSALDTNKNTPQEDKNFVYKEFVIAMRKDILGKTRLSPKEIEIYGSISL